jgi:hypothetical protein
VRPRIRKYDDLAREFSKAARRREQPARDADHRDHPASARESYFTAAVFYGAAQWAIEANTQFNLLLDEAARLTGLSRDLLYDEMRRGNCRTSKSVGGGLSLASTCSNSSVSPPRHLANSRSNPGAEVAGGSEGRWFRGWP